MKKNQPIGIFDSGIGGLTVAKAISNLLPNESLLYFGDTEHMPYGDRSAEHIRQYSENIAEFLIAKGAKILVIACNSASSVTYQLLKDKYDGQIDVVGVISPVVDYVVSKDIKKVGIIGTKATIGSKNHEVLLKEKKSSIKVVSLATPLLAPMIEEGFFKNKISKTIINDYLSRPKLSKIDSLILGCTHYPLIRPEIEQYYKGKVVIFDSANIVAHHVQWLLDEKNLLHQGKPKKHRFYISDYTPSFEQSTKLFFKGKISLEQKNLWK
jgi:glutamate racemase